MAKVAKIKQPVPVSGGLTKQDVILADTTGLATLTLWETDMDSVTDDLSYKFSNIAVISIKVVNICHYLRKTHQLKIMLIQAKFATTTLTLQNLSGVHCMQSYT